MPPVLRRTLILTLVLGVAAFVVLGLYADVPRMLRELVDFSWKYLPLILGLTLLNYLLRFLRWHYYLGLIQARVRRRDSLAIYFSGLAMVVTPARLGEWLKCHLLTRVSPTPISRSAPVIVAERFCDVLALGLLASAGLALLGRGWEDLILALSLAAVLVALARYRPLATKALGLARRLPFLSSRIEPLQRFYDSFYTLFGPRALTVGVGLGLAAWTAESLGFYMVVRGLGWVDGWLVKSILIYSLASLAGSLSLLPGGLGATEGGIAGMSQLLLGMGRSLAGAATLIVRLCTLWFGVALGVVFLLLTLRRLRIPPQEFPAEPA